MNYRKLFVVGFLGFAIGSTSLWNATVATALLFLNGLLVGMIAAGTSERPLWNLLYALGWGVLGLIVASAVLGLAKLVGIYANWAWPTLPESAVLAVWVGGCLMMLFWLLLGSLIRLLR
jgi:hypothetical protein